MASDNQNYLYAQQKDEKIKAKALQANLGYFFTYITISRKNNRFELRKKLNAIVQVNIVHKKHIPDTKL